MDDPVGQQGWDIPREVINPLTSESLRSLVNTVGYRRVESSGNSADVPPELGAEAVTRRSPGNVDGAIRFSSGIPILSSSVLSFDLAQRSPALTLDPDQAEIEFYGAVANEETEDIRRSEAFIAVHRPLGANSEQIESFPDPRSVWIETVYDSRAQYDGYRFIAPVSDQTAVQIGGKGIHAVKFLLAGARQAFLVTPVLGEAKLARRLAAECGVSERLYCIVGEGEHLPFADSTIDAAYSGGSMHHTSLRLSLKEVKRVLAPGGRFAAQEPWRAPFYGAGTRIFGKREREIHCIPIDAARLRDVESVDDFKLTHYGAMTRYALIAAGKIGLNVGSGTAFRIMQLDDAISSLVPRARSLGSSLLISFSKPE